MVTLVMALCNEYDMMLCSGYNVAICDEQFFCDWVIQISEFI